VEREGGSPGEAPKKTTRKKKNTLGMKNIPDLLEQPAAGGSGLKPTEEKKSRKKKNCKTKKSRWGGSNSSKGGSRPLGRQA